MPLLSANDRIADDNRAWFEARRLLAINLVSSPGSGKTTLLEATAREWQRRGSVIHVIEGDQHTRRDADRVRSAGARAWQINTGKLCHLEAIHIADALPAFDEARDGLLFVENVGNLICPTHFDLGEHLRVTLMSLTEGEDKPLKYPDSLLDADLLLITKQDLAPYLDVDPQRLAEHARNINPDLTILVVDARTVGGLDTWFGWLEDSLRAVGIRDIAQ